jgi:hypothetical protein
MNEKLKRKFKNLRKKLDIYAPNPSFYSFIMSKAEVELFDRTIINSKAYLEFGMGGSTFRALQKSKAKIYSIDSSRDWIKQMRKYLYIRYMEWGRLKLFHTYIGPTKEWGVPTGDEFRDSFPNYSARIFKLIEKESIDTVLVDGRFRVACTLKTILECHNNASLKILIHDFWNRAQYHIVLKYLIAVSRADTLGVFEIKKDIDLDQVKQDYDNYKFNPS